MRATADLYQTSYHHTVLKTQVTENLSLYPNGDGALMSRGLRNWVLEVLSDHCISWKMGPRCGCDNIDVVNVFQMEQRGRVTPASEGDFTGSKFVMINIYKVTQEKVTHYFHFVLLSILLFHVCRRVETKSCSRSAGGLRLQCRGQNLTRKTSHPWVPSNASSRIHAKTTWGDSPCKSSPDSC